MRLPLCVTRGSAVAGVLFTLACESNPLVNGPIPVDSISTQRDLLQSFSLSELESAIEVEQGRVEIRLVPDGRLVARELELKGAEHLDAPETVESRVIGLARAGATGALTLALGQLRIDFNLETEFRGLHGGQVDPEAFLERVQLALDAGEEPAVRAARRPAGTPSPPGEGTFVADVVMLTGDVELPELRVNVTREHLRRNPVPPPDGWITVLGLAIEVRVSEGITEIQKQGRDASGAQDFRGVVRGVDVGGGTLTLTDGTIVRVVEGTRIWHSRDHPDYLPSLAAAAEALARGHSVVASGDAILETSEPRTLIAIHLVLKLVVDDVPLEEFEGLVVDVHLDRRAVTLHTGLVVVLDDQTQIKQHDGLLPDLTAVARALEAGDEVVAFGVGRATGDDPGVLTAARIAFQLRQIAPRFIEFEGRVADVNLERRAIQLGNGLRILLTPDTRVREGEGFLPTLEEVAAALSVEELVVAFGEGKVVEREPLVVEALHIAFAVKVDEVPAIGFEGLVKGVEADQSAFVIHSGLTVRLTSETRIRDGEGYLPTLEAVAAALAEGKDVVAFGEGVVESEDPPVVVARTVAFVVRDAPIEVVWFEGLVVAVAPDDPDGAHLTLEGGTRIMVDDHTRIRDGDGFLLSLEAVAQALEAEQTVVAFGEGVVEGTEPRVVRALALAMLVRESRPLGEFRGQVASVNLDTRTLTLVGGTVVKLNEHTRIEVEGDLTTLGAVVEALELDKTVVASGVGELVEEGPPPVFLALKIRFTL